MFYMLARLMRGHDLRSIYTEDMRGVQLRMFQMNKLVQQVCFFLFLKKFLNFIFLFWFIFVSYANRTAAVSSNV